MATNGNAKLDGDKWHPKRFYNTKPPHDEV